MITLKRKDNLPIYDLVIEINYKTIKLHHLIYNNL